MSKADPPMVSHWSVLGPRPRPPQTNARGGWRLVQTHAGAEAIRGEPFDAVELDLGSLWSR